MKRSALSILLAGVIALVFIGVGAATQLDLKFPPNSLPWRPVELDQPPHWMTHWQIRRLHADPEQCRDALTRAKIGFTPMADKQSGEACGFRNVVRTQKAPIAFSITPYATCAMTAGLIWYQNRLQALAQDYMNSRLVRIDQIGTYACRNINNAEDGNRSQHATANAMDISGFTFANGRTARIARDWGKDTPQGRFLAAAHTEGCGIFNAVLGPEYNKLHADHFHLDMGPAWICR